MSVVIVRGLSGILMLRRKITPSNHILLKPTVCIHVLVIINQSIFGINQSSSSTSPRLPSAILHQFLHHGRAYDHDLQQASTDLLPFLCSPGYGPDVVPQR